MDRGRTPPRWLIALPALLAALWCTSAATAQARHDTDPRYSNAHVDRVVISSTAETHPQGTFFGSLYDLLPQVGYAFNQRVQASVTGLHGLKRDSGYFFEGTLKANVLRTREFRVAALTSIDILGGGDTDENLLFGRVGATVQWCFGEHCESSINVSAMAVVIDKADLVFPFGGAVGFIGHLDGSMKLLLEYGTLTSLSDGLPIGDVLPFLYAGYGIRFAYPNWAFDVTFIRSIDHGESESNATRPGLFDLLGFPLLALTYRLGHN